MVHSLSLEKDGVMNDSAIAGLSDGSLGRFLKRFKICIKYNVGGVLDMVEARKKIVDQLFEHGCTWNEEITILKDVEFGPKDSDDENKYKKRVNALKDVGITITFSC